MRAKANCTAVGAGINACGDLYRTGKPRPGSLNQEYRRFIIRFGHPERFDNRVVCHGYQTRVITKPQRVMFDDRLIRHGDQTGTIRDLIRHGSQTAIVGDA